jgi:hypothetical protein
MDRNKGTSIVRPAGLCVSVIAWASGLCGLAFVAGACLSLELLCWLGTIFIEQAGKVQAFRDFVMAMVQ